MTEQRHDAHTIYERFARRCEERQASIRAILAVAAANSERQIGDHELRRRIGLDLHDWIGEARMLGQERVAIVANQLQEVLDRWDSIQPGTRAAQFGTWVDRLAEVSKDLALSAPNSEIIQQLQELRDDLDQEMSSAEHEQIPTGELPIVGRASRRILVFDDSPIVREVLALELQSKGHSVALAATVAEFEQLMRDFDPELVFLDINMPEIKGDQVCRQMRRRFDTRDVPIVFLSSIPDDELSALAQASGANGFLSKQRGMEELVDYLDELLSQVIY